MRSPRNWKLYISFLEDNGLLIDAGLAKFNARYRFASGFKSLSMAGLLPETTNVYNSVARVAFAYSALESLEVAIKTLNQSGIRRQPITSREVASALQAGDFESLQSAIVESETKIHRQALLEKKFKRISENTKISDVRPFVEGLRNIFVHGAFTANSARICKSDRKIGLLHLLAEEVLKAADKEFNVWFSIYSRKR